MKFLHTADWQIGMKAKHVAKAGKQIREKRIEIIDNINKAAEENDVDFIIAAGDIFEDNHINVKTINTVIDKLATISIPVYIIPGNHDYYSPDSIYRKKLFNQLPDNIILLTENEPVNLPEFNSVLFPCPVFQKRTLKDPTDWIPVDEYQDMIRIAIAHGSLQIEGISNENDNPIGLDVCNNKNLDYLALGHWHNYFSYSDRVFYSGTPESTNYNEKDSGNVIIVEIEKPKQQPIVKKLKLGKLLWREMEKRLTEPYEDSVLSLKKEIQSIPDPENALLKLKITGELSSEGIKRLEGMLSKYESKFLHIDVIKSELSADILKGKLNEFSNSRPVLQGVLSDLQALKVQLNREKLAEDIEKHAMDEEKLNEIKLKSIPNEDNGQYGKDEINTAISELINAMEVIDN